MCCVFVQCTNTYIITLYILPLSNICLCIILLYFFLLLLYFILFWIIGRFSLFDLVTHCERFYLFIIMRDEGLYIILFFIIIEHYYIHFDRGIYFILLVHRFLANFKIYSSRSNVFWFLVRLHP